MPLELYADTTDLPVPAEGETDRLRRAVETLTGYPFRPGNKVEVLRNGIEIFPPMLEAIRNAEQSVDFETFVYWQGDIARRFANELADRARAGVRVRVLLDAFGSAPMDTALIEMMKSAGVIVQRFRSLPRLKFWESDHRTHRKILICDERIGFTGGVGIAEEWEGDARGPGEWRETHFRVEGPVVDSLRAAFIGDWMEESDELFDDTDRFEPQPVAGDSMVAGVVGSAEIGMSPIASAFVTMIQLAERSVHITTPYFNPTDLFVKRMVEAAQRGVDVQVLMPGPHIDKRVAQIVAEDRYSELLDGGVRIWRYQPSMLHTKCIAVDGRMAVVGSANFNRRSIAKDEEFVIVIDDPSVVGILEEHFEEDITRSIPVDPELWEERSVWQRAVEKLSRVIRPEA